MLLIGQSKPFHHSLIASTLAILISGGGALADEASRKNALDHIDPNLRAAAMKVLEADPNVPWSDETIKQRREAPTPISIDRLDDVTVEKIAVTVGKSSPDVTVYVINGDKKNVRPGIFYTHGGGYVVGSAEAYVPLLQRLAKDNGWVIVTAEYRLAPETTYKGSVEDNYAGLRWMYQNAADIGLDPQKIAIMGESAGGGHTALLAITARDRGEIPLVAQILIYPMLDDRTGTTHQLPDYIGKVMWTPDANRYGWKSFLGVEPGSDKVPTEAVPARAENLQGLPPAFIAVGGVDLFASEDIEYARRLNEAGVPTDLLVVPNAYHGFNILVRDAPVSKRFNAATIDALKRAFK